MPTLLISYNFASFTSDLHVHKVGQTLEALNGIVIKKKRKMSSRLILYINVYVDFNTNIIPITRNTKYSVLIIPVTLVSHITYNIY